MKPIAHLEQIRQLEQALADGYISLGQLMYNAGEALATRVHEILIQQPSVDMLPVVIFAGSGNNGGDGWVAAERLEQAGVEVTVVTPVEPSELTSNPAALMAQHALLSDVSYHVNPSEELLTDLVMSAGVVVDALLGTGFAPQSCEDEIKEPYRTWIRLINRHSTTYVVSADVPSGVNAQTGACAQLHVKADETVTMLMHKPALLEPRVSELAAGEVTLAQLFDPSSLVNKYEEYLASLKQLEMADQRESSGIDDEHEHAEEAAETSDVQEDKDRLGFTGSFSLDIFGRRKKHLSDDTSAADVDNQEESETLAANNEASADDDVLREEREGEGAPAKQSVLRSLDGQEGAQTNRYDALSQAEQDRADVAAHHYGDAASLGSRVDGEYQQSIPPCNDDALDDSTVDREMAWQVSQQTHREQVAQAHDLLRRHTCARLLELVDYHHVAPVLRPDVNKYSRGYVCIVGGSNSYPGAAVLAARAAEQSGAGYVRVIAQQQSVLAIQRHLVSVPAQEWPSFEHMSEAHLQQWMAQMNKAHALVLGPGLGCEITASGSSAERLVRLMLTHAATPLVIDADALNLLAYFTKGSPSDLGMLLAKIPAPIILTPHAGEFARLTYARLSYAPHSMSGQSLAQRIDDLHTLMEIFIRAGAVNTVVVYKGDRTLVGYADCPHDRARVCTPVIDIPEAGPASLARAGTGDVLAGAIGSLIAQAHAQAKLKGEQLSVQQSAALASLAVYAHGEAAWRVFDAVGSHRSVTPVDLCDFLGISIDTIDQEARSLAASGR